MQELIEKLQTEHGLSNEKSHSILNTVKEFIKEKFPMMGSAIDNLFPSEKPAGNTITGDTGSTEGPVKKGGSFLDKIPDNVPVEMGEKTAQFAKDKLASLVDGDNK